MVTFTVTMQFENQEAEEAINAILAMKFNRKAIANDIGAIMADKAAKLLDKQVVGSINCRLELEQQRGQSVSASGSSRISGVTQIRS